MPSWFRREILPGDTGGDVNTARRLLLLPPGPWDEEARHRLRGRTGASGWVLTAELAEMLGETEAAGLPPTWWQRELSPGMAGDDVASLRERLGLDPGDVYDRELEDAVRRWQSAHELPLTGCVDESLAILLGE